MAKRLTDTEKWDKSWFLDLDIEYKSLWQYLLEKCNHYGVIDIHIPTINTKLKWKFKIEDILKVFETKLYHIKDNLYFIPKFIVFQYGASLNPGNKCHASVISGLEKYNLTNYMKIIENLRPNQAPSKGLPSPCQGVKDKDKDKDKDKEKENTNTLDHDAKRLLAFLNQHTGRKFKSCEATLKNIKARLLEGFTPNQISGVMYYKTKFDKFFLENPKFCNPQTLCRKEKFPIYLAEMEEYEESINRTTEEKSQSVG